MIPKFINHILIGTKPIATTFPFDAAICVVTNITF